jgi:hypothetical protein
VFLTGPVHQHPLRAQLAAEGFRVVARDRQARAVLRAVRRKAAKYGDRAGSGPGMQGGPVLPPGLGLVRKWKTARSCQAW